jgi:hypothetical protein
MPRFVELYDPTAQLDIQSLASHRDLYDVGMLSLVCSRFTGSIPRAHVRAEQSSNQFAK